MEQESFASVQQIRAALEKMTGSKLPVKITPQNGEAMIRYVRGFADPQTNIVLLSETSYSLAMTVLEVKDVLVLEFAQQSSDTVWVKLKAKKGKKQRA